MAALKFTRKLGTTWVFRLTWLDQTGARQPITGWVTPKAFWRTLSSDALLDTDTVNITVDENSLVPSTFGDYTYKRLHTDQTEFAAGGIYRLDFEATMGTDVVGTPEQNYVIVEVKA